MITLSVDGWIVDTAMRLPFVLALDYLWISIWDSSSFFLTLLHADQHKHYFLDFPTGMLNNTTSSLLAAAFVPLSSIVAFRLLLAVAAFACWLTIKCFPFTQIILFAIWLEIVGVFAGILALNVACLHLPEYSLVGVYVVTQLLHLYLIHGLRQLRLLELMGLPVSIEQDMSTIATIGTSLWLYVLPRWPVLILAGSYLFPAYLWNQNAFILVMLLSAVPALLHILGALRWRFFGTSWVLRLRRSRDIRLSLITPYYFACESFGWHSVGEEIVNRGYSCYWAGKIITAVGMVLYQHGLTELWLNPQPITEAIVRTTASSWICTFGMCWVAGVFCQKMLSLWLRNLEVSLSDAKEREHRLVKFDLCGYLVTFLWLANALSWTHPLSWLQLQRILAFFLLYRLSVVPFYAGLNSQRLALEGIGDGKLYVKTILDGSMVPLGVGYFLVRKLWQAPLQPEKLFSNVWLRNRNLTFSGDFEVWFHGEAVMAFVDLMVCTYVTTVSTVASHAHLIQHHSPRFWHVVLEKTDWIYKVWSHFARDLFSAVLHSVVLTMLTWENRADLLMVTVIYLTRVMEAMGALHLAMMQGVSGQFFCWSRCIIHELQSPDEATFQAWEDVCSICRLEESERRNICVFPCGHFFHRDCIEQWLKQQMRCPLCMRKIWFANGLVKMDKM